MAIFFFVKIRETGNSRESPDFVTWLIACPIEVM
jgi:hypothetical protein